MLPRKPDRGRPRRTIIFRWLSFFPCLPFLSIFTDCSDQDELKQLEKSEKFAVHASNVANIVLFVAKVYASVESRSMAVIASTLDSFLDLLSGFILWFTASAMRNPNHYHYPIGKKRMQPVVSNLCFCSLVSDCHIRLSESSWKVPRPCNVATNSFTFQDCL